MQYFRKIPVLDKLVISLARGFYKKKLGRILPRKR